MEIITPEYRSMTVSVSRISFSCGPLVVAGAAYFFRDFHTLQFATIIHMVALLCLQLWVSWWRHQMETFPRNWPFVWGIHRSPVNSPHKGQWRGALMFSLICVWINDWVNNREAGDLRRYRAHFDVTVMWHNLTVYAMKYVKSSVVGYL